MECAVAVRGGRWSSLAAVWALLLSTAAASAMPAAAPDESPPAAAASATAAHSAVAAQGPCRQTSIGSQWEPHIQHLMGLGVITTGDDFTNGSGVCAFGPGEDVKRDDLLRWMQKLAESPAAPAGVRRPAALAWPGRHGFSDISRILRIEVVSSFARLFGLGGAYGPTGFADVEPCRSYFDEMSGACTPGATEVRALHECRYMVGYVGGTATDPGVFKPRINLTRGQAAGVLRRFLNGCDPLRVSISSGRVIEGEQAVVRVSMTRPLRTVLGVTT